MLFALTLFASLFTWYTIAEPQRYICHEVSCNTSFEERTIITTDRERKTMSDSIQMPQDTAKSPLLEQSKQRLRAFFQNPYVKKLTPILVPGALAAALLPVFGPVVAGTAAARALKKALD